MISASTSSIAASSGKPGASLTSSDTVRTRSKWRISVGPEVTSTSAKLSTGMIDPARVTTGMAPMPWVWVMVSIGPRKVRSIRSPSTVTSATRKPSLYASTVEASSNALTPLSAKRVGSGITRTSGAPSSSPGIGRVWCPSFRGKTWLVSKKACNAVPKITSRSPPDTSIEIEREPPTPRPNKDAWLINPNVPGSAKIGPDRMGISSPARPSSNAVAPTKLLVWVETKKKFSIIGGPPRTISRPALVTQSSSTAFSRLRAISSDVSRL